MPLDLDAARRVAGGEGPSVPVMADDGRVTDCLVISLDWLRRAVAEIEAGRRAAAELDRLRAN